MRNRKFLSRALRDILVTAILIGATAEGTLLPPAHAASEDAEDPAVRAFEALPEPERKVIRDELVWTGDYKGTIDGNFGEGTRDAITAFALRHGLPGDGSLSEKARAMLAAAATRARQAVGFAIETDARTKMKIGVPLKLLSKLSQTKFGSRYASASGLSPLETELRSAKNTALEDKFKAMSLATPNRKVTYKVLRPEFFVVTEESSGKSFFSRFMRGAQSGADRIAGFTLTYPTSAKATFEALSVAIANSFDPFPNTATTAVPTTPPPAQADGTSGVIIAPGLVLAVLPTTTCQGPHVGSLAARIIKKDDASTLSLLQFTGLSGTAASLRTGRPAPDEQIAIAAFASNPTSAPDAAASPELMLAPGTIFASGRTRRCTFSGALPAAAQEASSSIARAL